MPRNAKEANLWHRSLLVLFTAASRRHPLTRGARANPITSVYVENGLEGVEGEVRSMKTVLSNFK